jgi:poly(3-hydroxybutyrate) depolymerase
VQPGAGDDARALLQDFFAETDADARRTLAERFGRLAPADWAAVTRMLHATAPRPDLAPGTHTFESPAADPIPAVRYLLRVPAGYEPNGPQGLPLVVACHWTNSTAERAMKWIRWVLGPDADRYLLACPDAPDPGVYRAGRVTDTYPLEVLADVRRRANVDADRVVLTGYSRGGYQTWATALCSPGRWAGAVPIASAPISEAGLRCSAMYLENVLHLPIQAHWGNRDIIRGQTDGINTLSKAAADWFAGRSGNRFEPIEYEGQGHDLDLRREPIRTFVARVRRDPFPRTFTYLFHRMYQGRAYYVRATEAAAPEVDFRERVPVRGVRLPEQVPGALQRIWNRKGYHLAVRMPEGENRIIVTARNLAEVAVDLPAERLDYATPVRVIVNNRLRYARQEDVDWVCLLETARRTRDFERLVARRVTVRAR